MRLAGPRTDALGVALVVYGLAGLALLAASLVLVLGLLSSLERAAANVDPSSPNGIGARLDRVATSLDDANTALRGFDTTLDSTAASARDGQRLGGRLAVALRQLVVSLDVTVLGSRPFAGVGTEFSGVADEADALAADLATTAGNLDANRAALRKVADEITGLRDEVRALRSDIAGTSESDDAPASTLGSVGLARVVVVALLAWLALAALTVVGIGLVRVRGGTSPVVADTTGGPW